MSSSCTMAAFLGVADVPAALGRAEVALRDVGLVDGDHDPEAVLAWRDGVVLRPGQAALGATVYGQQLLDLKTNGVAFRGGPYFNAYAVGFAAYFECPSCGQRVTEDQDAYGDQMSAVGMAAAAWCDGDRGASAACQLCGVASVVTEWGLSDPVFLADMAVEFWNWPYLDPDPAARAQWWRVDVVGLLEQAVGGEARLSGYKV